MQENMKNLVALQEVDLQIAKLEQQIARIPSRKKEAEQIYAAEKASFDAAQQEVKAQDLKIRALEREVSAQQEKKRAFQQKTDLIKNNDEYRAALAQLKQYDEAIAEIEERQLLVMETQEAAKRNAGEKERLLRVAERRAAGACQDLTTLLQNCQAERKKLLERRAELLPLVEESLLHKYERLRANKKANPLLPCVAPVENGSCGRCRVRLTPQLQQTVSKDESVVCANCGAILYAW